MKKDLLTLNDINIDELEQIFTLAEKLKKERGKSNYFPLSGKSVGMIFAKSSTRTRVSFEVGIRELGGNPLYLNSASMQVGRGETIADTAKVLSRYLHGVVIRTFSHSDVETLAKEATFPVVNALTDEYHPCQILADMMTVKEHSKKPLNEIKMVFAGDGSSNICNSLMLASKLTGMNLVVAAPEEYRPCENILNSAPKVTWEKDIMKAAENADYLYTDVYVSMGFEDESKERLAILKPYQVNKAVINQAKPEAKFLHCLPAHRGEEVSADVMDSPASIVFDQAENRLHVQKAVLSLLFENFYK